MGSQHASNSSQVHKASYKQDIRIHMALTRFLKEKIYAYASKLVISFDEKTTSLLEVVTPGIHFQQLTQSFQHKPLFVVFLLVQQLGRLVWQQAQQAEEHHEFPE